MNLITELKPKAFILQGSNGGNNDSVLCNEMKSSTVLPNTDVTLKIRLRPDWAKTEPNYKRRKIPLKCYIYRYYRHLQKHVTLVRCQGVPPPPPPPPPPHPPPPHTHPPPPTTTKKPCPPPWQFCFKDPAPTQFLPKKKRNASGFKRRAKKEGWVF